MKIKVQRLYDTSKATIGALFIDDKFECFTLEDEKREVKVKGETRIPAGTYKLGIRDVGGFHMRYSSKFGRDHKGMIQVLDVPNFEYILIHIGNTEDDTAGCLLVGETADVSGIIGRSTPAYKKLYSKIIDAVIGGKASITYVDNK